MLCTQARVMWVTLPVGFSKQRKHWTHPPLMPCHCTSTKLEVTTARQEMDCGMVGYKDFERLRTELEGRSNLGSWTSSQSTGSHSSKKSWIHVCMHYIQFITATGHTVDDSKHQFHIITIALKPTTIAVLNSFHQRLSFSGAFSTHDETVACIPTIVTMCLLWSKLGQCTYSAVLYG